MASSGLEAPQTVALNLDEERGQLDWLPIFFFKSQLNLLVKITTQRLK